MRSLLIFPIIFVAVFTTALHAQHGGKAEPNRIRFAPGKSSTTLTGVLSTGQQMEYVFAAKKGQTVTIRNPNHRLFDFKVYSEENFPEGDFDSSPGYTFEVPETGNYMFYVRKKQVKTPRTARFSLILTIK